MRLHRALALTTSKLLRRFLSFTVSFCLPSDSTSVVVVHGLHGNSKSTSDTSYETGTWLKDKLFPDQSVRIMKYDYGTSDTSGIICKRKQFSNEASKLLGGLLESRKEADGVSLFVLRPSR